ncbi:MAG: Ig-like domain repeat protein [Nocardioides sp.]|uniref:Ig-like domain repeat protein n=1 Tax=Nocardioides sp. TaxID=35761 RepID=UPI0039E28704
MHLSPPRPGRPRFAIRWSTTARLAVAGALGGLAVSTLPLAGSASAATAVSCDGSDAVSAGVLNVADGETCTISGKTTLDELVVADGGSVVAPDGYDVTLTVDGVETGQAWDSIEDVAGTIQAGTYQGADDSGVVLTVTTQHTETGSSLVFPIRQSLYVDSSGIDDSQSVAASWTGSKPGATKAKNFAVTSTGSTFNGAWVDGADYTMTDPTFTMTGNGRDDFVDDGAAVTGTNGANLTLDGATIKNKGVVRTGVISDGGANVVVKNSDIDVSGGDLPSDYTANVSPDTMIAAPWMLGLEGTNRATLLLGDGSKATYLNTSVTAADWGALSTDSGSDVKLNAINSKVTTTDSGYGTYAIGSATGEYLGTDFDVASYLSISANGENVVHFGDSDADDVAALNTDDDLGLSDDDLASVDEQTSTLTSARLGFMTWAGDNTVDVDGGTKVTTGNATFEDKSQTGTTTYNVTGDEDESPSLKSGTGVIVQVMDQDDPGPGGSYTDPTSVTQSASDSDLQNADLTARTDTNLTGTTVKGDFFNGSTVSKNLVVNLSDSTVKGRISSATAVHEGTVDEADYTRIGMVTNTVSAPVNGGVIADLTDGSTWRVTGTSYLTSLTVDDSSSIVGSGGKDVTITQGDNTYTPDELVGQTITGTYADPIEVSVADGTIGSTTAVKVANTTYGKAGSAKVTVVDADGDAASGDVTVKVDGTTAGTATLSDAGTATVALPAKLSAGKHTVTATYAGNDDDASSTARTTFTVAKLASTSKLSLAKSKIHKGKQVRATIKVTSSATPTGRVSVLNGSKVIGRYTLSAKKSGKLTVTLHKFTKAGTYHLRAVYAGSTNVAGSKSAKVTLRVVK